MKNFIKFPTSLFSVLIFTLFFFSSNKIAKADPFDILFDSVTYTNGSQIQTFPISCGDVITLPPGGTLRFIVYSFSLSISNTMLLSSGPLPPGAAFPPANGMTYVQSIFTWTPTGSFIGDIEFHLRGTATVDCTVSFDWPLPVELSSFTSFVFENDVTLNWKTSSESNNSEFVIERSEKTIENTSDWIRAGSVPGNGTISSPMDYTFTDRDLNSGYYQYRLKQIDFNGNFEYHNLKNNVQIGIPGRFELSQNYPNPFNPRTIINYELGITNYVKLIVYDVLGNEVASLVNEKQNAGYYSVEFDGSGFASGIYFYSIEAGNFISTKKMLLVK